MTSHDPRWGYRSLRLIAQTLNHTTAPASDHQRDWSTLAPLRQGFEHSPITSTRCQNNNVFPSQKRYFTAIRRPRQMAMFEPLGPRTSARRGQKPPEAAFVELARLSAGLTQSLPREPTRRHDQSASTAVIKSAGSTRTRQSASTEANLTMPSRSMTNVEGTGSERRPSAFCSAGSFWNTLT
jgi:hypothetical protein